MKNIYAYPLVYPCLPDRHGKIAFHTSIMASINVFSFWHRPKKKQKGLSLDIFSCLQS
jgi:hypothetical protein